MSGAKARATVGDVVGHLDGAFPFAWAEPWDRVGLLAGDPETPVTGVFVTLDPTAEALAAAAAAGANVVVSHHPAFLESPAALTPRAAGVAYRAASQGIALVACHTNLDRAPAGADALPAAVGLVPSAPLERGRQDAAAVTVYVPADHAAGVVDAMTRAGGGRIGEYRGCAFSGTGIGTFIPGEGTHPVTGTLGERSSANETRVEMMCAPGDATRVTAAARAAHPYEEPLIVVTQAAIDRGAARLGRLCPLKRPVTLQVFAERIADAFGVTPRLWGDPDTRLTLAATLSGSGGSLLWEAVAAGASVLLTGEVRYHTALEALAAGVTVVEAGHDVTEWPHVPVLAAALRTHPALAALVVEDVPARRWWTP